MRLLDCEAKREVGRVIPALAPVVKAAKEDDDSCREGRDSEVRCSFPRLVDDRLNASLAKAGPY